MSPVIHSFDWPDRFVVGTVGNPGSRTFYLQVRTRGELLSVALEKQQSAALGQRLDEVLEELRSQEGNPFSVPKLTPEAIVDNEPLDQPVQEQFRVGAMSLGWDPSTAQIVIEAIPFTQEDTEEADQTESEPSEILVVRVPVGAARAFAERTREVVDAGRPICSLCHQPMDPEGHVCELPDGFR